MCFFHLLSMVFSDDSDAYGTSKSFNIRVLKDVCNDTFNLPDDPALATKYTDLYFNYTRIQALNGAVSRLDASYRPPPSPYADAVKRML